MGQQRRWTERILDRIRRLDRSVLLAFLLSLAFFVYVIAGYLRSGSLAVDETARWAAVSALLFIVLLGILRVLFADIRGEIVREREQMKEGCGTDGTLLFFVTFKALVRCVVGVNLVLLWMAGLFAILGRFAGEGAPVGVVLALLFSFVMLLLAFGFVTFLDRAHYPCD